MVVQYQKVKAIKVRVYKWKERIISEEFSKSVLLQCTIINETMHIKRQNNDLLEASRGCAIVPLDPLMEDLPLSYNSSRNVWDSLCFSLLTGKEGDMIIPETAYWLSKTIAGYLTSNYHATRDISHVGERDFKIVVVVNVYMKSIEDESVEIEKGISLDTEGLMYEELMHSDQYSLKQRKIIGPIDDFVLEIEDKIAIFKDFLESNTNSLLNVYTSSGDENLIFSCIIEWLIKEPHRLRANPQQEYCFAEVELAL